jgi:hypothetical protein
MVPAALRTLFTIALVIYRLFQCRFFICIVQDGENTMHHCGNCPFLDSTPSLQRLHRCLLPSDTLGATAAAREKYENPATCTLAARGKPADWPKKMKEMEQQVQAQPNMRILAGFGSTLAGQVRDLLIFASSPDLKANLKASPIWTEVRADLCGLTPDPAEYRWLRGALCPTDRCK